MWTWTLNFDEIRKDLVVGSCPMKVEDLRTIREEAGATGILSLQHDECLADLRIDYREHLAFGKRHKLTMQRCPMRDFDTTDQGKMLGSAVRMLNALLTPGRRVYVHCTAGINRSPLVVLGYLTWVEGQPSEDVWSLLKARRPVCAPDRQAFQAARSKLVAENRNRIVSRSRKLAGDDDPKDFWERAAEEVIREVLKGTPTRA